MSVLDLRICPICRTESSLVRQTIKLHGERRVVYDCLNCDSQLLWLGDDLWMQADRWAYQKIGRADMEHLLRRSMTADDLRALASQEAPQGDGTRGGSQPPAARSSNRRPQQRVAGPVIRPSARPEEPPAAQPAYPQAGRPSNAGRPPTPASYGADSRPPDTLAGSGIPEEPAGRQGYTTAEPPWIPEQPRTWDEGTPPGYGYGPYPAWAEPQPAARRRGRGSPFLVVSVALALLCLICSAAAMIASTTFTGRAPLGILATPATPAEVVPTQALAATATLPVVESPVPTESPQPVPTKAAALQFQGVTEYRAASGTHYVVGEVLNTTASNLWFVQILATFFDDQGQVIGGGSTYTELSIIEAGSSAPFKLATLEPPPGLARYELSFDYQTTDQGPLSMELVDFSSFSDEAGWHHIVGDLRNDHEFAVKFPEIVAVYYNASHEVIRVEMTLSALNAIQPGEVSPFEVVLVDPPPELHHYALQTEALRQ